MSTALDRPSYGEPFGMSTSLRVYESLLAHYGPQHWWPAESPFEVAVGAVLVQNTAWKNVERAIANLRDADALNPHRLYALHPADLEALIRPAGYYRLKTRRLRNLVDFLLANYHGSFDAMRSADSTTLRRELLQVNGVGPETADSILLYALGHPAMVVDAYTLRVWSRHGWIGHDASYHQLQSQLTAELPPDAALYNELHALLVRVGHDHCRRQPRCEACPLRDMLPPNGVVLR